jgi:hypothetical protein
MGNENTLIFLYFSKMDEPMKDSGDGSDGKNPGSLEKI